MDLYFCKALTTSLSISLMSGYNSFNSYILFCFELKLESDFSLNPEMICSQVIVPRLSKSTTSFLLKLGLPLST